MKKNNCIFCSNKGHKILEESQNFFIIAERFPVVRGSILIIPKRHFSCFGDLPEIYIKELNYFQEKVKKFFMGSQDEMKAMVKAPEDTLIKEARKYKSAEEFADKQINAFHQSQ